MSWKLSCLKSGRIGHFVEDGEVLAIDRSQVSALSRDLSFNSLRYEYFHRRRSRPVRELCFATCRCQRYKYSLFENVVCAEH